MSDKNLYIRIAVIVLVVTVAAWEIWPPSQRLKGGIDLVGGTSLLYQIDTAGLSAPEKHDIAERVMRQLKQRVDPEGQRNLVWRPVGQDRLEIEMPRPPEGLVARRDAYEKARDAVRHTTVDQGEVEAALALKGKAREEAFAKLVRGVPERAKLFTALVAAGDKLARAKAAVVAAGHAGESRTAANESLGFAVDEARAEYYRDFDRIAATNIDLDRLGDIVALGADNPERPAKLAQFETAYIERLANALGIGATAKERAQKPALDTRPGARQGLAELRSNCAPLFSLVDRLTKAYDAWARNKGALADASDLMRLLRGQGVLEFRILAERDPADPDVIWSRNPAYRQPISRYIRQLNTYGPRPRPGDDFRWFKIGKPGSFTSGGNAIEAGYLGAKYVLAYATPDKGMLHNRKWQLTSAVPAHDRLGRWAVSFTLNPAGGARFEKLTEANVGHPLCILLDNVAISAPNIESTIRQHGEITGDFTLNQVSRLCSILEAGSLEARLDNTPLSIQTIGPGLGRQNRRMGMQACITALVAVVAFMAFYYLYGGVIADVALALNMLITLGIMAMIQGTFTLQGIAGLVLTLGMAVDANVLIFERIREEQARGVSLKTAVKLGYDRAFWVIFDSHLTTIISAIILGYVGTEEIKGFALTLGLGLVVSLFTALFVTRQFFSVLVQKHVDTVEVKRCWGGTAIIAIAGGLMVALGWAFHHGAEGGWRHSGLAGLGEFLLVGAAAALVLLSLIWLMRWIALASGAHKTNHIPMLHLIKPTNIDWMGKAKYFWGVSAVLTLGGLLLFALQPKKKLLDIEFLGGTSVQVTVEPAPGQKPVTGTEIEDIVTETHARSDVAGWIDWAASRLESAEVDKTGDGSFLVLTNDLTKPQLEALLAESLRGQVPKNWIHVAQRGKRSGVSVRLKNDDTSLDAFKQDVLLAAAHARTAAEDLRTSARVQSVEAYGLAPGGPQRTQRFEIVTTVTNKELVSEAILAALARHHSFILHVERGIGFHLVTNTELAPNGTFPITTDDRELGDVIGQTAPFNIMRYRGGVAMVFDHLTPPQTIQAITQRLRDTRLESQYDRYGWRDTHVFGLTATGHTVTGPHGKRAPTFSQIAIVVNDPNLPFYDNAEAWSREVARPELHLAESALSTTRSLDQVTSFAPQIARQAGQQAVMALVLALLAMVAYLWFRFGTMEYGLGAIIALIHDVAVAVGLVTATHWIARTFLGHILLINEMRIDLSVVAAFLTIVGYSVNDTIVVFDRIRENRGRLAALSPKLINDAINQTIPRTILTAFTVFLVLLILYVIGGAGVHAFAFAMLVGTITGCYSSIAIASPILYRPAVMRAMLAIIVLVAAIGTLIGTESPSERIAMAVVAAIVLALLAFRQFRRRGERARPQPTLSDQL